MRFGACKRDALSRCVLDAVKNSLAPACRLQGQHIHLCYGKQAQNILHFGVTQHLCVVNAPSECFFFYTFGILLLLLQYHYYVFSQ